MNAHFGRVVRISFSAGLERKNAIQLRTYLDDEP